MKIVIVETTLDSETIGGGNLYLPGLLKGLVQSKHEVHLVVKGTPNPKINKFVDESGVIIHTRPWKKNGLVTDIAPLFAQWVNKLKPDVYMISASFEIGWLALPFLDPSIATFTLAHSNTSNYYLPVQHYKNFITTAIGVSDEICNNYKKISNIPADKVQWIPYGIKPAAEVKKRTDNDVLTIVYAGRLIDFQKRASDVKLIAKKFSETGTAYHFHIIGDGDLFENMKLELAGEISKGNIEMHGWVAGDKVLETFQNADILILTSDSEGFSVSLTEAMANGCCPVVTDIPSGSIQLIKTGQNGFLIKVGNINGFVDTFLFLNNNRDELLRIRKEAWETGKKFSIDRMVDSYLTCFEKGISYNKINPKKRDSNFPAMPSARSKYPVWLRRIKFHLFRESAFRN